MTTDLIEHNPMLKKPLLAVLALCEQHPDENRRAIEERSLDAWDDAYSQSPTVSVDILVRNGALDERMYVDGEPYDGTLEDLQVDANIPDDATAESRIALTDTGRDLLETYAPDATLCALFADKPRYQPVFQTVLDACSAEAGCSRSDLEQAINAMPQLAPDPATKRTRVYPQFFIDALESAGGIAWDGAWRITEAGRGFIAA